MKWINLLVITIFILLFCNIAVAKLSEEQLNEAVSKVYEKVPNCNLQEIRNFVISQDCEPPVIRVPITFSCGDATSHSYECRFGVHYFDEEVISILSSKTDIHNTEIKDSNFMQTGDIVDSKISQGIDESNDTWIMNLFLDINFYIGIALTIALSLIIKFILKPTSHNKL